MIADPVQWILQVHRPNGTWVNRSYCRTKEALIRCCRGSTPELDALPDRIGDHVAQTTGPWPEDKAVAGRINRVETW